MGKLPCNHGVREVEFPGGRAQRTVNDSWVAYYDHRPGEAFRVEECPACGRGLWGVFVVPVVGVLVAALGWFL